MRLGFEKKTICDLLGFNVALYSNNLTVHREPSLPVFMIFSVRITDTALREPADKAQQTPRERSIVEISFVHRWVAMRKRQ
mmetsp:Transcript_451/g.1147  ORF Transcript_451/g.1147 Transcript_451/m.1147 type:complete len:81 (-) Transcript_451:971-1213(-)